MFHKHSGNQKRKAVALLVCLTLAATLTVGSTLAFLVTKTDSIVNIFTPTKVTVEVDEKFENAKEDVKIKNTGTTDAWIRAAVVITWKNEAGDLYGTPPVETTDYTITWNLTADGWVKGKDGYYYWTKPVVPDSFTGILITKCEYKENQAPAGYYLNVDVVASGLQSKPNSVFNDKWGTSSGLTASGDKLSKTN